MAEREHFRSAPVQRHLIHMMEECFPDFQFKGTHQGVYGFTRKYNEHIYDHVTFERDFYNGTGYIHFGYLYCCFQSNWPHYPAFVLGERIHRSHLISGSNMYPSGWKHWCCYQTPDGVQMEEAMEQLAAYLRQYALPWFTGIEDKLFRQGYMPTMIDCAEPYMQQVTEEIQKEIFFWMHHQDNSPPALYQQALETVKQLPEFQNRQDTEKLELHFFRWVANRLQISDYY